MSLESIVSLKIIGGKERNIEMNVVFPAFCFLSSKINDTDNEGKR